MKSFVALCLCASLASQSVFAQSVLDRPESDDSTEIALIEGLLSLQGSSAPASALEGQVKSLFAEYDRVSPREGRSDRYSSALVEMGLLDESRLADYRADLAQVSLDRGGPSPAELSKLASRYLRVPAGHEFNAHQVCRDLVFTSIAVMLGSFTVMAVAPNTSAYGTLIAMFLGAWAFAFFVGTSC